MCFTEKEIELARRLKNTGWEWKPQAGDYYYGPEMLAGYGYGAGSEHEVDKINLMCCVSLRYEDDSATVECYAGDWSSGPIPMERCVWLPLLQQVMDMLIEPGTCCKLQYTYSLDTDKVYWKAYYMSGDMSLETTGGTALEAMYRLLLGVKSCLN